MKHLSNIIYQKAKELRYEEFVAWFDNRIDIEKETQRLNSMKVIENVLVDQNSVLKEELSEKVLTEILYKHTDISNSTIRINEVDYEEVVKDIIGLI